ncbi:MAG: hypothetical protein IIA45_14485 [Bacteroidetes bacterium]|nr:hypothetical protein [Bacteroidota bacterium]
MSKNETPITRAYWKQVKGTLIEEFPVVKRGPNNSGRWIDAVIIINEEFKIAKTSEVDIQGKDIICVQTKSSRLNMYLMGQAYYSDLALFFLVTKKNQKGQLLFDVKK